MPLLWSPAHLCGSKDSLRMRHQDCETTIWCGQASDALWWTIRVQWISLGCLSLVINKFESHQAFSLCLLFVTLLTEVSKTFTVRHSDWQLTARHALQEDWWWLGHFNHHQTCFVLFGFIACELRPSISTWNDAGQVGHHLTSITNT